MASTDRQRWARVRPGDSPGRQPGLRAAWTRRGRCGTPTSATWSPRISRHGRDTCWLDRGRGRRRTRRWPRRSASIRAPERAGLDGWRSCSGMALASAAMRGLGSVSATLVWRRRPNPSWLSDQEARRLLDGPLSNFGWRIEAAYGLGLRLSPTDVAGLGLSAANSQQVRPHAARAFVRGAGCETALVSVLRAAADAYRRSSTCLQDLCAHQRSSLSEPCLHVSRQRAWR